jgi:phenylpropionate dioxygenase-like ring-hydroxylating dioxygenase large terminal subunit
MLSNTENELLCRVGPDTAMGKLMREYWLPAIPSNELPSPDCPPVRIRLLGENLIAFRTTSGDVGLIQNACPHRGASMFFGRNEEEGLRCVYHGWKFDTTGACVDMPSEPAESNFKNKVRTVAYPCRERNGIVWAYMGPRNPDNLPGLPDLEANMLGEGEADMYLLFLDNNWMQGWEGEMDTVHAAFLHSGATRVEDTVPGTFAYYQARSRSARFDVVDTEWGTSYGVARPAEDDTTYWRIAHQLLPFYAMVPTGVLGLEVRFRAYVPMDDEHTMMWTITKKAGGARAVAQVPRGATAPNPAALQYKPNGTGWLERHRLIEDASNDYMINREWQASGESYSGIKGIRQQDMAVTGSMGAIYNRSQEHLGTTDALIIRTRRCMLQAAKALRDHGITPPGVDNPEIYALRSGGVILQKDLDWWDATRDLRRAFVDRTEMAQMAALGNA